MQQPSADEITLWREILAGVIGVATGAVGVGYFGGRKSRDLEQHETRLKALEDVLAKFASNCAAQHKAMLDEVRRDTLATVRMAESENQLKIADQLHQINIHQALTMRMQEEMSKDVESIFERLNRRQSDAIAPQGTARRFDDPQQRIAGDVL